MFSLFVDLINSPRDVVSKAKGEKGSFLSNLIDTVLFVYTLAFCFFRVAELIHGMRTYPLEFKTAFIGVISLWLWLPTSMRRLFHVAILIALVYAMDVYLVKPLSAASESYVAKTVFITGANSGIGFETARQLVVNYGMNVILGCRSLSKCNAAVNAINAEANKSGSASPLLIDLSNFDSVKEAATHLMEQRVNVLYNNAGFAPGEGVPVNEHMLDPSFTAMHFSHFLLTELLLQANPSLRVVYTSSGTHHMCAQPFAYLPGSLTSLVEWNPGCVDEHFLQFGIHTPTDSGAYFQAKIANVMHAVSIPLHHPQATSVAIDLGWVGTSIQPWMTFSVSPTSLKWMRNTQIGVLPAIHAILSSNEELLDGLAEDRQWSDGGIIMNTLGFTEEAYSLPWWTGSLSRDRMLELGRKLWITSEKTIGKFISN